MKHICFATVSTGVSLVQLVIKKNIAKRNPLPFFASLSAEKSFILNHSDVCHRLNTT